MSKANFEHSAYCDEYSQPRRGECSCGATKQRETWNAAVDACAQRLLSRAALYDKDIRVELELHARGMKELKKR